MKLYLEFKDNSVKKIDVKKEMAFNHEFIEDLKTQYKNLSSIYYYAKSEYYVFGSDIPKYTKEKFYVYGYRDPYKKLANYLTYYGY